MVQGGSFMDGFVANAAGAAAGVMSEGVFGSAGEGGAEGYFARTTVAAVAGGTASVLTGGKFANAAITAAFAHMWNYESPQFLRQTVPGQIPYDFGRSALEEGNYGAATASFGIMLLEQVTAVLTIGISHRYQMATRAGVAAVDAGLTGQVHHGISRTVYGALESHPKLKGIYTARDPRFVTQAKDLASHRGYDRFHRDLDTEIVNWIQANRNATQQQFETHLRSVYQRPDVLGSKLINFLC